MEQDRSQSGKHTVETVTGPIALEDLGVTLPHDHVIKDTSAWHRESDGSVAKTKVTMSQLGRLRHDPFACADNVALTDEALAARELELFRASGGQTILDPTCIGIGRDVAALARISQATGVRIIAGCGYYVSSSRPAEVHSMSIEEIEEIIVRDVVEGADGTNIRSGFIGEIGITDGSTTVSAADERVLRAATRAHARTGVPLMVHLIDPLGDTVLDIIESEGGHLPGTVLCHMVHTRADVAYQTRLAKRGVWLGYDTFGFDWFLPAKGDRGDIQMPCDAEQAAAVMNLISSGFADQLLLSSDLCLKIQLVEYGGCGYAHVLDNIIPRLQRLGASEDVLRRLLIDNPRQLFANAARVTWQPDRSHTGTN